MQLMIRDKNYDYAHAMFADCVIHDPGNLIYVEALFRNFAQGPTAKELLVWKEKCKQNDKASHCE